MNRPTGLEKFSSEFWEEKYWEVSSLVSRMQNRWLRAKDLEELNHKQAARIMELELILSCINRVGNSLIVDSQSAQNVMKLYPDVKRFIHEPRGLSSSRYLRNDNE